MKKIDKINVWITSLKRWWQRVWYYDEYISQPNHWTVGVNSIYNRIDGGVNASNHIELEFKTGVSYIVGKSELNHHVRNYPHCKPY